MRRFDVRPRFVVPTLLILAAACNDDDSSVVVPPPPPPSTGLNIQGADMSGSVQNILVQLADTAVSSATVVVNGTAMTYAGSGLYQGTVTPTVAPGGQVTVVVSAAGKTATGVGVVPPVAVIGTTTSSVRGAVVGVNWTIAAPPDSFLIGLNFFVGQDSYITAQRTAGSARSAILGTSDIPANASSYSLTLFPFNVGTFTGDFAPGSNMRLRTLGADKLFAFGVP